MSLPSSQRLVQPWQACQVDKLLPSTTRWRQSASSLGVGGTLTVLLVAMLAHAFDPQSAGTAAAAAAWGFLTFAHLRQGSQAPQWPSVLPLVPLAIFFAAIIGLGSSEIAPFEAVKKLGALTGLAALAAALHLSLQRPEAYRQTLLGTLTLGSFFVSMSCVIRIFTQAGPDAPLTMALIFEVIGKQPDLITMALVCLSIGLGMALEPMLEGKNPPGGILIAMIPLALPIGASRYGSMIAGMLFALAVFHIITRCSAKRMCQAHKLAIVTGSLLTFICFAHAWFKEPPHRSASLQSSNGDLWNALHHYPLFGRPDIRPEAPSSDLARALLDYGYAGVLLILLSLAIYVQHTCRFHRRGSPLAWWCWIACAVILGIGLWHTPLDHSAIALMGVTLLVIANGELQHRPEPLESKNRSAEERSQPTERIHPLADSGERGGQPAAQRPVLSLLASSNPEGPGKPGAPLDPSVRLMRRFHR